VGPLVNVHKKKKLMHRKRALDNYSMKDMVAQTQVTLHNIPSFCLHLRGHWCDVRCVKLPSKQRWTVGRFLNVQNKKNVKHFSYIEKGQDKCSMENKVVPRQGTLILPSCRHHVRRLSFHTVGQSKCGPFV
jgi:hypothetical protein